MSTNKITAFLKEKASPLQKWSQEVNEETFGPRINGKAQLAIQIPVHAKETGLKRTLNAYTHVDDLDRQAFQIIILINNGTREEIEKVFSDIESFCGEYPDFPITCLLAPNPQSFANISEIRAYLALKALIQWAELDEEEIAKRYMLFHDSDMHSLSPEYFTRLEADLESPEVLALGGRVKYASDSQILQFLNRVELAQYSLRLQRQTCKPRMCGANSAVKTTAYIDAHGHDLRFVRKVNIPIRDNLIRLFGPQSVMYDNELWISTDARRPNLCLSNNDPLVLQHQFFGRPNDYSEKYFREEPNGIQQDQLSPSSQLKFLSDQLSAMLRKSYALTSAALSRKARRKLDPKKGPKTGKEILRITSEIPELSKVLKTEQQFFQEACQQAGAIIEINGLDVILKRIKS